MATAAENSRDNYVSIGRILERSLATIRHNPLVTLGIAFLFGALPTLLLQSAFGTLVIPGADVPGLTVAAAGLAMMAFSFVIASISQAALTRAILAEAEGSRARFGETLAAALSVLLPLIGLSLLIGIAVMIGLMFLIVPGVILYLMWAVAVPALVAERRGIMGSLGRSRDLTRGARWKIFGLFLVLVAVYWMISAAFGALAWDSYDWTTPMAQQPAGMIILEAAVGTVTTVVWATVQASLYVELRNCKDGPDTRNLEEVFS